MPFPGVVFDLEVLGPNHFVMALDEGETARVQTFTAMGGFQGTPFSPPGEDDRIEDVAVVGGGYWVSWIDGETGSVRAQRFDASGSPRGEEFKAAFSSEAGQVKLFPLAGDGVLIVWSQRHTGDVPAGVKLPDQLQTALFAVAIADDGSQSEAQALDPFTGFDQQRDPAGLVLSDGSVVVGWVEQIGSGGFGSRLAFTQFGPDGARLGHPVEVSSPSPRRRYAQGLTLVPVKGDAGFASVFGSGRELAVQRFDARGFATSGVEFLPYDRSQFKPLYFDDGEVIAQAEGASSGAVMRLGEIASAPLHQTDQRATASVTEADHSVVVAYVINSGGDEFSYLYRVVREN